MENVDGFIGGLIENTKATHPDDSSEIKLSDVSGAKTLITDIISSKDKESFKAACKKFIGKCEENGIKTFGNKRKFPVLYTNNGLSRKNELVGNDLLLRKEYLEYIKDTDSPPFSFLWSMMDALLITKIEFPESPYITEIVSECRDFGSKNIANHIPYDRVLSEVWVENIPDDKLAETRIEYGQNCISGVSKIEPHHVFFEYELPIFLLRVAKYNTSNPSQRIDLDKTIQRINKERIRREQFQNNTLYLMVNSIIIDKKITNLLSTIEEKYRECLTLNINRESCLDIINIVFGIEKEGESYKVKATGGSNRYSQTYGELEDSTSTASSVSLQEQIEEEIEEENEIRASKSSNCMGALSALGTGGDTVSARQPIGVARESPSQREEYSNK